MSADPIWKAFAESGDPLYYLLYKAVCMDTAADKKQSRTTKRGKQGYGSADPDSRMIGVHRCSKR